MFIIFFLLAFDLNSGHVNHFSVFGSIQHISHQIIEASSSSCIWKFHGTLGNGKKTTFRDQQYNCLE